MNPLNTIIGTLGAGVVLSILFALGLSRSPSIPSAPIEWTVWLHVLAGITWVGLLYYFNFVQLPAVAAATADTDGPGPAAITRYIAPRALLWFRWAAVVTWLSGAAALGRIGILVPALTFDHLSFSTSSSVIGMGAWLGTIMLINVWVLIWPSQKKLLGLVSASDAEKAAARRLAFVASRINTALSIPMLMGMTAYAHGLPL